MTKHETIDAETGEVLEATAVVVAPAAAPAPAIPAAATPMLMLDRAVASGASIETLERLMSLQERWQASESRKAFDAAIAAAKSEIGPIEKNRRVRFETQKGKTDYRFEDLAAIAQAVDPVLSRHGLSYRYRTSQAGGQLTVSCVLSHRDGYSEETTLSAGYDQSGNKNSHQAVGSALTYLQRYTLKAALGLAVAHDDDAQTASPAPAQDAPTELTASQVKTLRGLIRDSGADEARLLATAKVQCIEDIKPADFPRLEALLKRKLAEKTAAAAPAAAAPAAAAPAAPAA
jgi:hypothetical protein